ncbi:MAG: hypothetical protein MJ050_07430 [Phascolarctobacterium sp.]|nr:hypothetical protein [Phascolarctobacterium sp.]
MKYSSRWCNPYNQGMGRPAHIPAVAVRTRKIEMLNHIHRKAYFDTLKYLDRLGGNKK